MSVRIALRDYVEMRQPIVTLAYPDAVHSPDIVRPGGNVMGKALMRAWAAMGFAMVSALLSSDVVAFAAVAEGAVAPLDVA